VCAERRVSQQLIFLRRNIERKTPFKYFYEKVWNYGTHFFPCAPLLQIRGPHTDSKSVNWRNILDEFLNVKLSPIVKGVFDGFIGWAESLEWLTDSQELKIALVVHDE
jgi:hypothetical protein